MYLGIDGCRGGWLVAMIDDKQRLNHQFIGSLDELSGIAAKSALIDIPLGFAEHIYRPSEVAARALLGPKKSASVFYTPHRTAVYACSYQEADRLNRVSLGKGL